MKESQNIEFKQSWRDEYLQYICGFANAQGGTLYIGIDDKGEICGIKNAHTLLENLPNQINQSMGILAEVNLLSQEGKEYLSVVVKQSSQPISYRGKYYIRSGSTLQEMNGIALRDFLFGKIGVDFEQMPNQYASLKDIDRQAIVFFLNNAVKAGRIPSQNMHDTTKKVLQNLDLLTDDGKLKNAAVLLFGKNPQHFFINSYFRLGRFGSRPSDLMFQDEVGGNILQMADRVIWLLRSKYLRTPIHYEGLRRIEELEIPEAAMRELLYNAIIHRNYMGDNTQMKVYNDHVELWNAGELPDGYNTHTLQKEHRSILRNRLIANVFYKAGFIENWGRGFDKVSLEFADARIPFPMIENSFGGASVTIQRKVELEIPDTNVPEIADLDITERQKKILELVEKNPSITAAELANKLNVNSRTIQRDFAKLFEKGILIREGSDKAGERNIKMS